VLEDEGKVDVVSTTFFCAADDMTDDDGVVDTTVCVCDVGMVVEVEYSDVDEMTFCTTDEIAVELEVVVVVHVVLVDSACDIS